MLTKGSPPDEIERARRARQTQLRRHINELLARIWRIDHEAYEVIERLEGRCG